MPTYKNETVNSIASDGVFFLSGATHSVKRQLSNPLLTKILDEPFANHGILDYDDLTFTGVETQEITDIKEWAQSLEFMNVDGGPFTVYIDDEGNVPGRVLREGDYVLEEITLKAIANLVIISDDAGTLTVRQLGG